MNQPMRIRTDNSLFWRQLDDEIIALDLQQSIYMRLNQTGTILWQALQERTDRQELIATLVDAYGIDEARAADDVDAFLASLEENGLLEK